MYQDILKIKMRDILLSDRIFEYKRAVLPNNWEGQFQSGSTMLNVFREHIGPDDLWLYFNERTTGEIGHKEWNCLKQISEEEKARNPLITVGAYLPYKSVGLDFPYYDFEDSTILRLMHLQVAHYDKTTNVVYSVELTLNDLLSGNYDYLRIPTEEEILKAWDKLQDIEENIAKLQFEGKFYEAKALDATKWLEAAI